MDKLKKLTTVLIAILTLFGCSNQKQETGWTKDGLKGKVQSFNEFSYDAIERFGKIEKGERLRPNIQKKYDEKGNMIESNSYNSDGSLSKKSIYKYDEKGNMIESNSYNSYLNGKSIYKYDEKGNRIEWNYYRLDGRLDWKFTYKYDEKGNQIESNSYNSDGSLSKKSIYKYDEKGNQTERNFYNSDGSLDSKQTYKYVFDEKKNWTKQIEFINDIPIYIIVREYVYYK